MDVRSYNRQAWDRQVEQQNPWTIPVTPEQVAAARRGEWSIVLTPVKPVPREWFPPLRDLPTLCLAASGGQQAPILAAAGARVTVLDNSPRQLEQDRLVAEREGLRLELVEGDMRDLGAFADGSFGLVVHPVSNCFVPEIRPVWREAARVLRPGGVLLAAFINPDTFIFDYDLMLKGELVVRHRLPYSDLASISQEEREELIRIHDPFVFSHSLEEQLGGQADAGLAITGLYEDTWPDRKVAEYVPCFVATRAVKPREGASS